MVSTYNQAPDLSASTCQSGKDGTKRSGLRSTDGSPGAALAVFSPASLFCVRGTFLSTQTQTRRVKYMVCSCEMLECWVAGRTCIAMGRRRKVRQCRAKPEPAWQSGSAKCHATPRSGLIHAIPKAGRDSLCFSAAVRSDNGTMSSRPSRCLFGWPAVCLCSSTLHANEPRPPIVAFTTTTNRLELVQRSSTIQRLPTEVVCSAVSAELSTVLTRAGPVIVLGDRHYPSHPLLPLLPHTLPPHLPTTLSPTAHCSLFPFPPSCTRIPASLSTLVAALSSPSSRESSPTTLLGALPHRVLTIS